MFLSALFDIIFFIIFIYAVKNKELIKNTKE